MAEVTILSTDRALEVAAQLVVDALVRCGPGARFGIPGGSALGVLPLIREMMPAALWNSLRLTWVDERLVPLRDAASNRGEALHSGALSTAHPVAFELPLVQDGEGGDDAVERVRQQFEARFKNGLDVALLGMGEDGHVASLFPGHALLAATQTVAWLGDSPKPPSSRVTLTMSVLSRPELNRVVVAMGSGKREALNRLMSGDDALPVTRLGKLTVVTDQHFPLEKDKS